MEPKPKRKVGRPRTKPEGMEKASVSMMPETKHRLRALAEVQKEPAYAVIEHALKLAWKDLSDEKRYVAETLARAFAEAEARHAEETAEWLEKMRKEASESPR